MSKDAIIATGDVLKINDTKTYSLIVTGDINKDGKVNIKDLVRMRKYLLVKNSLDDVEKLAADCNLDDQELSIKDMVRMRVIILTQN